MADNPQFPVLLTLKNSNLEIINQHLVMMPKDGSVSVMFTDKKEDRTSKQNRLSHLLYTAIQKYYQQDSFVQIKCKCKYHLGLPIIIQEAPDLADRFKSVLVNLDYEKRIESMQLLSLTSLFNVSQFAKYLTAIYQHYESSPDYPGLVLPRPDDLYDIAVYGAKREGV